MKMALFVFLQILTLCSSQDTGANAPSGLSFWNKTTEGPWKANVDESNELEDSEEESDEDSAEAAFRRGYPLARMIGDSEPNQISGDSVLQGADGGFAEVVPVVKAALPPFATMISEPFPNIGKFLFDNTDDLAQLFHLLVKVGVGAASKTMEVHHERAHEKPVKNSKSEKSGEDTERTLQTVKTRSKREVWENNDWDFLKPGSFVKGVLKFVLNLNAKYAKENKKFIGEVDDVENWIGFAFTIVEAIIRFFSFLIGDRVPVVSSVVKVVLAAVGPLRKYIDSMDFHFNMNFQLFGYTDTQS